MKSDRNGPCPKRQGSARILSLLFIVIFFALAAAIVCLSGANVQIAHHQRKAAQALASVHSGIEILRYHLQNLHIPTGVAFHGNASTVSSAIAASGVQFRGNASGAVDGTVINYSDNRMELSGNANLTFNRSDAEKIPAGFEPCMTLEFMDASYHEPL